MPLSPASANRSPRDTVRSSGPRWKSPRVTSTRSSVHTTSADGRPGRDRVAQLPLLARLLHHLEPVDGLPDPRRLAGLAVGAGLVLLADVLVGLVAAARRCGVPSPPSPRAAAPARRRSVARAGVLLERLAGLPPRRGRGPRRTPTSRRRSGRCAAGRGRAPRPGWRPGRGRPGRGWRPAPGPRGRSTKSAISASPCASRLLVGSSSSSTSYLLSSTEASAARAAWPPDRVPSGRSGSTSRPEPGRRPAAAGPRGRRRRGRASARAPRRSLVRAGRARRPAPPRRRRGRGRRRRRRYAAGRRPAATRRAPAAICGSQPMVASAGRAGRSRPRPAARRRRCASGWTCPSRWRRPAR